MQKIILSIEGMTCSACSSGLEKYLNKQKGINKASVNLVMASASVEYDEKILDVSKIEEFVQNAGFKSLGEFKEIKLNAKSQKEKIVLIISTILIIFMMYISMGHMLKLPSIPFLDSHTSSLNYMICLLIISLSFMVYGFDILKNGYKNLLHKTPNMDTLVGLGVITSFLYSLYNMYLALSGHPDLITNLYFESSASVIYFVKLGRFIDSASKDKTKEAIQKLVTITPNKACIKVDDKIKEVTLDEIQKGDIVVSKAGEKIAVDGIIIMGSAHLDESFITGESKPVSRKKGQMVIAGSLNYDGYLEYSAQKIGKDSTVSEIVKLVVEASNTKAPIASFADKVASYFVPGVIIIAILTFIGYLCLGKPFSDAITSFVTVLVVACPCSLGLATPLAIIVSEGICVTNGILIKKSAIMENAAKTNTIVFDKTGTLTYGNLQIAEVINYSKLSKDDIITLAGSIEKSSSHPIASAFTGYLDKKHLNLHEVSNIKTLAGLGITGDVKGQKIILGNAKILEKYKIKNNYQEDEKKLSALGCTIVYVANEKEVLALIGVSDIIRAEAPMVIQKLKERNIEPIMLTGDNPKSAQIIAEKIGITNIIAGVLPKEKTAVIKKLKQENKFVMMCGDGINDSPALASSDIGVSIKSGTEIAMDSSDVILTKDDLESIIKLLNISKKTLKNIKQNLFWAFFYNTLMIPVAIGLFKPLGLSINPMLASIAMVLSSLTVILNTLRLKKIKF